MYVIYLVPVVVVGSNRGPAYFNFEPGPPNPELIMSGFAMMDYGFTNWGLLIAKDISREDQEFLALQSDVFRFPDDLDGPVDQDIQAFFEGVHLPTDWMTPSTTWRELLRQTAGMFQFNQRYAGIAAMETGEAHSIFDNADLSTRLRQMTADEQQWFLAAVDSFGFDSGQINDNNQLRLLVKQAGSFWEGKTFLLGGVAF
jgi:hypothetical protein